MSNRLLLVSSHFPPDRSAGTHRVLRLANDLQQHGWTTFVLTIDPAYYINSVAVDEALVSRVDPRVTLYRTGAYRGLTAIHRWRSRLKLRGHSEIPSNGVGLSRDGRLSWRARTRNVFNGLLAFPDDEIGWLGHAIVNGVRIIRRHQIDVMISSAPPFTCHVVGQALKRMTGITWVSDFRDPWSRAPWGKSGSIRAHAWLEENVINRSDAVLLNTPELHREFSQWYGPEVSTKFHTVANGFEADILWPHTQVSPPAGPPLILTHAGNLVGARDPIPLLQGLEKCLREGTVPREGIRLNLVGKVAPRYDVDSAIVRLGLTGTVTRTAPVAHGQSLRTLAASHVLVVIQPGTALQIPVKLYEYVGLRRVILALTDEGAVSRVVRDGGFGLVVSPTNVDEIAKALTHLYRNQTALVQTSMNNPAVDCFDARHQSESLRKILSSLTPSATNRPSSGVRG